MVQYIKILKKSIFYVAVGLLAVAVTSEIKKEKRGSRRSTLNYDGQSVFGGILRAYKRPLTWHKNEFIIAGFIITGLAVLFYYDNQLSKWFTIQGKKASPFLKNFGWYYGSPENHYAINGGFYLYGLIAKNEEVRKTGVLLISTTMASGLFQTMLKIFVGRARPLRNEGKASFKPFSGENSYYSFPSGHSILSFTTAYAIGTQFNNPILKMTAYLFGTIAPLSRLWAGAHFVTDAVVSICLSIPIVNRVDKYLIKNRKYSTGLDAGK